MGGWMTREVGQDILLCERCGYPIGGLDDEGACPECGLAIEDSLARHRVGSPWQQRPSARAWWTTLAALCRSPAALFRVARVDGHRARSLQRWNLAVAAALIDLAPLIVIWHLEPRTFGWMDGLLTSGLVLGVMWPATTWVLWVLTNIEWLGIRFFGRRRGWRITPGVATTVCAHATYGWVLAGSLALLPVLLAWVYLGLSSGGVRAAVRPWWQGLAVGGIGCCVGLLVFETLVYVGVRQCRHANLGAETPIGEAVAPGE